MGSSSCFSLVKSSDTTFSFGVFCLFVGNRMQLLECIFVISKRRLEFDLFGIDQILIFISLFYLHLNVKL